MKYTHQNGESLFFNENNKAEMTVEPDIYFDEKDEKAVSTENSKKKKNPREKFYTSSNAVFLLESTERLLEIVHSGKELKILQMRLKGMNYRTIASIQKIGLASIARFIRRVSRHHPRIGFLLENAPYLQREKIP